MKALLTILGIGRTIAAWLLGMFQRYPWPMACAVALALAWWQWSGKEDALAARNKARMALAAEKTSRQNDLAAWRRQVAAAQAAAAAAERKSQEIATHAQTSHDAMAADNAGLRAYIADRRLRAGSGAALAASSTDDLGPPVHGEAAGPAIVAADEADLLACDGAYVYAASAYEWGRGLITAGLAKSSPP